jgi:hypothetical protein
VFCVLLAKRAAVLEVQCGLLLRAKVPAKPLVHAQEGRYSSPLCPSYLMRSGYLLVTCSQADGHTLPKRRSHLFPLSSLSKTTAMSEQHLSFFQTFSVLPLPPSPPVISLPLTPFISFSFSQWCDTAAVHRELHPASFKKRGETTYHTHTRQNHGI